MNKRDGFILRTLFAELFVCQRILSEKSGHVPDVVKGSLKALVTEGYQTDECYDE